MSSFVKNLPKTWEMTTLGEALRQSILKKALYGQLAPQDPHDEPASALLARIKAERAKSPQHKQTRRTVSGTEGVPT